MKNVFYLDDDELVSFVISKMLEKLNFKVYSFRNFKDFENSLKKKTPDFILLDITMPDKSGLEIYDYIKENFPGLEKRTYFITGNRSLVEGKNFNFIEKPVSLSELEKFLKKVGEL